MEKDTENQILNELKNINKSLQDINKRVDNIDSESERPFGIWDVLKSLLIGVLIVGPAIIVVITIFQIAGTWVFR
ncbi:hypothetical protein F7731_09565 [Cytobacillus depressus]|uniref:Uncharacterized protein n=1 Tax=Cytobacillus depressus TaxID=1602942 RepID=A0A6L3VAR9_9BACI|nr:hypothetical protein [Cytobacillus depressus]KAB2336602.1 hypothetical protein F7731_09565 [Cytobacillus depressus]